MQMPLCLLLAVSLGITGCDNSGSIKSSLIEPDSVLSINHVDTVYQNTLIVEGFNLVDTTLHLQDKLFSYGISASLPELISPDSAASKLNQLIKADFSLYIVAKRNFNVCFKPADIDYRARHTVNI